MDKYKFGKNIISQLLVMSFVLSACMPSDVPTTQKLTQTPGKSVCPAGSNCATDGDGSVSTGTTSLPPKVEIRHLIEPNLSTDLTYSTGTGQSGGGSYVRKLTLPKNFAGRLYLAGINFGSLASNIVRVRFKFGVSRDPITIPATVTQAPGITPSTSISVLVMDLRSEPFRDVRLPYDLFDYNDYAAGAEPVQDNRDTGLYCRGLRVEDDPTFQGVGRCDGKEQTPGQPEEECLYAYAKVLDQGLVKISGSTKVPLSPSFPQIKSTGGSNYLMDTMYQKFLKPLPDIVPYTITGGKRIPNNYVFSQAASPVGSSDSIAMTFSPWAALSYNGSDYYYRGPYRLVNTPNWEFGFALTELHGKNKLFKPDAWVDYPIFKTDPLPDDYPVTSTVTDDKRQSVLYYQSYLFPLATKIDLNANVSHLASSTPDGVRSEQTLTVAGKTLWMDGANARAQSRNSDLEHVGSCNVTATMEIIAKDSNGVDYVIAMTNEVKLQLVRPTLYRTDSANEVLYANFKTCTSNGGCGGSECCFNNRCWDQSLVSQCFDSTSIQGNRNVGESCSSDMECSSLCCNRTSGMCSPHNSLLNPPVLCNKPIGDYCIAKEWCQKSTVVKCLVIKTGTDTQGNTTCRQQCYYQEENGDCKNGVCVPPTQETIPAFDPNDPNACDNAVPAPNF